MKSLHTTGGYMSLESRMCPTHVQASGSEGHGSSLRLACDWRTITGMDVAAAEPMDTRQGCSQHAHDVLDMRPSF